MIIPFRLPEVVYAGRGAIDSLYGELNRQGVKRALVITDKGVAATDVLARVASSIEAQGIAVEVYKDVEGEPTVQRVNDAGAVARNGGFDYIIGLGGGSPMDVAKGASVLATSEVHSILEFIGTDRVPKPGIPLALAPTTAGTGSEVTMNAIFAIPEEQVKKGVVSKFLLPRLAVIDPELTVSCPPQPTAAAGADALIHAIESYTSKRATPHTDLYALEAVSLIGRYLRRAVAAGGDMEAREGMSLGSFYAGVSLANAGVGAVHALAYPLGGRFHLSHGLSNALLLLPVLQFNMASNPEKFMKVAAALGEPVEGMSIDNGAELALSSIKRQFKDIGLPDSLATVGIPESALGELAEEAIKQERLLTNNPRTMTLEDINTVYRQAWGSR